MGESGIFRDVIDDLGKEIIEDGGKVCEYNCIGVSRVFWWWFLKFVLDLYIFVFCGGCLDFL